MGLSSLWGALGNEVSLVEYIESGREERRGGVRREGSRKGDEGRGGGKER